MGKTHWKKLKNPNYLGAYSLDDGFDIVLTIREVKKEVVVGSDGKKEELPVCYWVEDEKPMIIQATVNMKALEKACGSPYIEDWCGHKVQIYSERVRAFGTVTDALRIRSALDPSKTKQATPIACEQCGQVITDCFGMSAAQWAKYSKEKLGKCLCEDCSNKAAEEKNKK